MRWAFCYILGLSLAMMPISAKCSCASRLTPTPRRGVAPAYSIDVRVQNVKYRITVALQDPSAQSSSLLIQILWDQHLRDQNVEAYLLRQIQGVFGPTVVNEMNHFVRVVVTDIFERDDFTERVKKFKAALEIRFSSMAAMFPSVSPAQRSRSADISEAARMMTGLLQRNRVAASEDEANRLLNQAHSRLIGELTESELRFFDYALFDEVIPYEKDLRMQEMAQRAIGELSPKDLDYHSIHAGIRSKFITISRALSAAQRSQVLPYIRSTQSHLDSVLKIGNKILAEFPPTSFYSRIAAFFVSQQEENQWPFSRTGFAEFANLLGRKQFTSDDVDEFLTAMNAADVHEVSTESFSRELRIDINGLLYHASQAKSYLHNLTAELDLQRSNEPTDEGSPNRLYVRVQKVLPGSGSTKDSAYIGMEPNMPGSFLHQPRRLNSGRGNQKERFDYDTPEPD
jgi:hypothetical protein